MFDIGATEMLLVVIVALLVIGPKDLPLAMRTAGRWMGKVRGMTKHFRSGIDAMIREAEVEEQEKLWAERNAKIMEDHPPEHVMQEGEGALPDTAVPDTALPDTAVPDTALPDTAVPDTALPNSAAADPVEGEDAPIDTPPEAPAPDNKR